jgi:cyclic beta-1,2-glucan synthetase
MYQFIVSSLVGIELKKDQLSFNPCFPFEWPSIKIQYRYGKSMYHFTIFQLGINEESRWQEASISGKGNIIQLTDDGLEHKIEVHVQS